MLGPTPTATLPSSTRSKMTRHLTRHRSGRSDCAKNADTTGPRQPRPTPARASSAPKSSQACSKTPVWSFRREEATSRVHRAYLRPRLRIPSSPRPTPTLPCPSRPKVRCTPARQSQSPSRSVTSRSLDGSTALSLPSTSRLMHARPSRTTLRRPRTARSTSSGASSLKKIYLDR
mgnify:CR=1 FL=1